MVPAVNPVTMPDVPTDATDGLEDVQVPPPVSVRLTEELIQTWLGPPMPEGDEITLNTIEAVQPEGSVYEMVVVPVVSALMMPEDEPMVATAVLLLLHVPPVVASASVAVAPTQADVGPVIGEKAFTVSTTEVKQPPGSV